MTVITVTGTNTDVGKTHAVAALARIATGMGLRVLVCKPAQTGESDGVGDIYTVKSHVDGVDLLECARFPEPLAPNVSARRAGMKQLELPTVASAISDKAESYDLVLLEGAGGVRVRLADDWTLIDLAAALDSGMIVVTSLGLGSLNLAELTVREIRRSGLPVHGLIGGMLPPDPDLATRLNIDELPTVTGVPYLGSIPRGEMRLDSEAAAREVIAATLSGQLSNL